MSENEAHSRPEKRPQDDDICPTTMPQSQDGAPMAKKPAREVSRGIYPSMATTRLTTKALTQVQIDAALRAVTDATAMSVARSLRRVFASPTLETGALETKAIHTNAADATGPDTSDDVATSSWKNIQDCFSSFVERRLATTTISSGLTSLVLMLILDAFSGRSSSNVSAWKGRFSKSALDGSLHLVKEFVFAGLDKLPGIPVLASRIPTALLRRIVKAACRFVIEKFSPAD
ncbi:hypothetical protein MTO96_051588 [Rhipicephalus appendiculatus]